MWQRRNLPVMNRSCAPLLTLLCIFLGGVSPAPAAESTPPEKDYFPPPESQGGWRILKSPGEVRAVAGMDPARLQDLRDWLLKSDDRKFAAVVIRRGHVVLQVERGNDACTDSQRL